MNGLVSPSVRALVINPTNPSIMYLASTASSDFGASRGCYKSVDGGNTWTPANNGLGNGGIIYVVIDPLTPSTLYASSGFGVMKSTDSGGTWNLVGPQSLGSVALAIDPVTPTTLYSADNNSGGKVSKSTDGGANWQVVSNGYTGSPSFIAIDPKTLPVSTADYLRRLTAAQTGPRLTRGSAALSLSIR
ncbi:MAG: hypothetical protein DMF74_08160 [Acidobacteria bacterium]|nr:MAG: hypothetical protein DMF74_08160 [Acidobacteriota bacterium]